VRRFFLVLNGRAASAACEIMLKSFLTRFFDLTKIQFFGRKKPVKSCHAHLKLPVFAALFPVCDKFESLCDAIDNPSQRPAHSFAPSFLSRFYSPTKFQQHEEIPEMDRHHPLRPGASPPPPRILDIRQQIQQQI